MRVIYGLVLFMAGFSQAADVWTAPDTWCRGALGLEGKQIEVPALSTGSVYRLSWEAKSEDAGSLEVGLSRSSSSKAVIAPCGPVLSDDWEAFSLPFMVPEDQAGQPLWLTMRCAWTNLPAEIRNVSLQDLGAEKPLSDYARSGRWYAGQEAQADWRQEAAARIEQHRKADLTLRVIDSAGNALKDVRVVAEQQSHAYRFGVAVNSLLWRWVKPGAETDRTLQAAFEAYRRESGRAELTFKQRQDEIQTYFDVLESDFNYVVFENALKWEAWVGEWAGFSKENTFELIDWLRERDIGVKAHALVWPGWRHMPGYLRSLGDRPEALRRVIDAHITDQGIALSGRVQTVDVLNEAYNNTDLMKVLGNDEMAAWFRRAKMFFPDAQLNVNDFRLMANGGQWTEKLDFYDELVSGLLSAGAPLEGICFQSHFRHTHLTAPERIWELCDRFGRFELPLVCSEFDVNLPDEQLQAAYTRDFLTAWFAHPDTQAFIQWGFWQDSHWLPYGGLYDRDWRVKPNAQAYRDLVFEQWWSGWEEGVSDESGIVSLRGFLGTYRITLYVDGKEKVLEKVQLNRDGTELTICL